MPIENNSTTQSNVNKSSRLISFLLFTLILTLICFGFGTYIFISNKNFNKRINELEVENIKLKTDTPSSSSSQVADWRVEGFSSNLVRFSSKRISFEFTTPYKNSLKIINVNVDELLVDLDDFSVIDVTASENYKDLKSEQEIANVIGNRYSVNECAEIKTVAKKTARNVEFYYGTITEECYAGDTKFEVSVKKVSDKIWIVSNSTNEEFITTIMKSFELV